MSEPEAKKEGLKKELGLFSVFALATGTTLSGGFFLLPGVALAEYQESKGIVQPRNVFHPQLELV